MSQTVVSSQLIPGARFLDKYRVDRLLGEGGMGVVFAATHLELQDRVAIKLLHQEASSNSEIVLRFVREARAAAQLRSENVVRVYDVGRVESGEPYMVMELLDGHDLANGPLGNALPIGEAVDYVIQACDAMVVAHELGMVHRDLKPANLFLTVDRHGVPTVKVLDFGISKLQHQGSVDGALTQDSAVMGSPLYMSPEQVRSAKTVDARADIWSLGTILFELVTGRTPFEGDTLGAVLTAVAVDAPPLMSSLRDDVPPGLDAIVAKCLEKDPAWRYQTAAALQEALLPFGSARSQAKMALRGSVMPPTQLGSGSSVPPATRAAQTNTTWADTDSGATPPVQPAPERTRRGTWALLAVLAALLAVGGSAIVWTRAAFAPATVSSTTAAAAEPLPVVSSGPPPAADRTLVVPEPRASTSTSEESLAPRPSAMPTGPLPRRTARARQVPPASPTPGGQQRTVPAPPPAQPPPPPNRASPARGNDHSSPLDIDFK